MVKRFTPTVGEFNILTLYELNRYYWYRCGHIFILSVNKLNSIHRVMYVLVC